MNLDIDLFSESAAPKSATPLLPALKKLVDKATAQRIANRALKTIQPTRKPGQSLLVRKAGPLLPIDVSRTADVGVGYGKDGKPAPAELKDKSPLKNSQGTGYSVLTANPTIIRSALNKSLRYVREPDGIALLAAVGVGPGGKRPATVLLTLQEDGSLHPFAFVGMPASANVVFDKLVEHADAIQLTQPMLFDASKAGSPTQVVKGQPTRTPPVQKGNISLDDIEGTPTEQFGGPGQPIRKGSKIIRKGEPVYDDVPEQLPVTTGPGRAKVKNPPTGVVQKGNPLGLKPGASEPPRVLAPTHDEDAPEAAGSKFLQTITAPGLSKAKLVKALQAQAEIPLAVGQNPVLMDLSDAMADYPAVQTAWSKLTANDFENAIDPSLLHQFEDTRGLASMLVTLDSLDGDSGYERGYMFWLTLYMSYSEAKDYASELSNVSPDLLSDEIVDMAQSLGMLTAKDVKLIDKQRAKAPKAAVPKPDAAPAAPAEEPATVAEPDPEPVQTAEAPVVEDVVFNKYTGLSTILDAFNSAYASAGMQARLVVSRGIVFEYTDASKNLPGRTVSLSNVERQWFLWCDEEVTRNKITSFDTLKVFRGDTVTLHQIRDFFVSSMSSETLSLVDFRMDLIKKVTKAVGGADPSPHNTEIRGTGVVVYDANVGTRKIDVDKAEPVIREAGYKRKIEIKANSIPIGANYVDGPAGRITVVDKSGQERPHLYITAGI